MRSRRSIFQFYIQGQLDLAKAVPVRYYRRKLVIMDKQLKTKLAVLTSNVLNPFLITSAVITLISFQASNKPTDALRWAGISILLSIFPVLTVIIYLVRKGSLGSIFINVRKERNRIYLLAAVCVLIGVLTLYRLGAPAVLIAAFVADLTSIVVFMLINLLWKISVHTAFVAASVTVLIILFGAAFSSAAFLVPLTGWARIELKRHSLAQVAGGAVLAAVIAFVVFYSSGLV